ncbi:uncharacterized protein LOC122469594 [Prionailurus bengalensis]|uniref:uncharacterized protein LOC122469594 n=1 Tax=Prionailurus bengalensis TaxID=37029 RepID=UPI001CA8361F|nr:uncharacterized protein LOC122469594 [Prionailurus bengalensis]XP_043413041.1 uncharacterized protein LOC122469594 [Prionailurus bengalensis]
MTAGWAEGPSPGPQPVRGEAQVWRLWAGRGPPRAEAPNAKQRQAAVPHGPWAGRGQSPWGARHIGGQNGTSPNLREYGSGSLGRGLRTLLEHRWLGVGLRLSKMPLQKPERPAPQKVTVFGNGLFTKAFRLQRGSRGGPRAMVPVPFEEEAIRTQARTEGWPREGTGRGRIYTPGAEPSRATGPVTADLTLPAPELRGRGSRPVRAALSWWPELTMQRRTSQRQEGTAGSLHTGFCSNCWKRHLVPIREVASVQMASTAPSTCELVQTSGVRFCGDLLEVTMQEELEAEAPDPSTCLGLPSSQWVRLGGSSLRGTELAAWVTDRAAGWVWTQLGSAGRAGRTLEARALVGPSPAPLPCLVSMATACSLVLTGPLSHGPNWEHDRVPLQDSGSGPGGRLSGRQAAWGRGGTRHHLREATSCGWDRDGSGLKV